MQCFNPGGNQMASPGRISSMGRLHAAPNLRRSDDKRWVERVHVPGRARTGFEPHARPRGARRLLGREHRMTRTVPLNQSDGPCWRPEIRRPVIIDSGQPRDSKDLPPGSLHGPGARRRRAIYRQNEFTIIGLSLSIALFLRSNSRVSRATFVVSVLSGIPLVHFKAAGAGKVTDATRRGA